MIYSAFIRRMAFRGIDFVKGSPVAHHIKDLKRAFADPVVGRKLAQERLEKFLEYACATTPFYKKFAGAKDLREFPVIQKSTIRENYDDFLSSAYDKNDLVTTTTSGSYGAPMKFYLTKDKRARQTAEVIYFNGWAGYKVGMRYSQVRAYPRGRWRLFLQNGVLMNPSVIDADWLERQRQRFKKRKIRFIIGYPSAIMPLANYCMSKGDGPTDFAIRGIITGAESLLSSIRENVEKVFGCQVLDRYSSNECGVMSHECAEHKRHHINLATHKFELLKVDRDEPVEADEVGRVVVTDFFSYALPLIRYDTGDLASWAQEPCPCGMETPCFENIQGRAIETLYDPAGRMISPIAFDRETKDMKGILRFQLIQKTKQDYLVRLHVISSFDQGDIMQKRFQKVLGREANIKFEYVDSIPPLPSGKRPYIINEFKRSSEV